ncbi:hypothetical protein ACRALDRAFT_2057583 [Sodiomyces alcalophilus JCM 7366]|uniref:uncharacterized protein n=1 Tax=Sodiomyces alcalophilus JCM 7366 TaxID=591952 RepID=UPI0039B69C14
MWIIAAAVVVLLAIYLGRPGTKIPKYKGDGWLSFLSDAEAYSMRPIELLNRATAQCGNVFSIQVLTVYNVFLRGNELNKAYLEVREDAWSFGGGMGIFINKILDDGYFDHLRTLVGSLSRYINRASAQEYTARCTTAEAEKTADAMAAQDDVALFDTMSGMAHKIIVRTLMGEDFYGVADELLDILHDMEADIGSLYSFILPSWVPHPPARRLEAARQRFKTIFFDLLDRRGEFLGEKASDAPDYVTYTMHDKTTVPLKHYMPSHHTVLMFAAHTSTVASIAWNLVCMLRHPDVLARVQADLRADRGDLVLQACIKETGRYYAGIKTLRLAKKEIQVPGTDLTVPKGAVVSIAPYLTHHDPDNWPSPEVWDYTRWIDPDTKELVVPDNTKAASGLKYIPFGYGTHRCVGEKMASIIVTGALTTILRDYDIAWATPETPDSVDFTSLDFDKIGTPWLKGDVRVKLTKRA